MLPALAVRLKPELPPPAAAVNGGSRLCGNALALVSEASNGGLRTSSSFQGFTLIVVRNDMRAVPALIEQASSRLPSRAREAKPDGRRDTPHHPCNLERELWQPPFRPRDAGATFIGAGAAFISEAG